MEIVKWTFAALVAAVVLDFACSWHRSDGIGRLRRLVTALRRFFCGLREITTIRIVVIGLGTLLLGLLLGGGYSPPNLFRGTGGGGGCPEPSKTAVRTCYGVGVAPTPWMQPAEGAADAGYTLCADKAGMVDIEYRVDDSNLFIRFKAKTGVADVRYIFLKLPRGESRCHYFDSP